MSRAFSINRAFRDRPRQPRSRGVIVPAMVAILLLPWAGCQRGPEPTYPVEGTVLLDGKPLSLSGKVGTVLFTSTPEGGREKNYTARGILQEDGTYRLSTFGKEDGAVEGRHRVAVTVTSLSQPSKGRAKAGAVAPSRYYSPNTSGLEVQVKPESNHIDLELTGQ